jgi:hypothetical protein
LDNSGNYLLCVNLSSFVTPSVSALLDWHSSCRQNFGGVPLF